MIRHTTKESITSAERLQLLGLLTLAQRHNLALQDIRKAAEAITGEDEDGHTGDAIYDHGAPNVDELLRRTGLVVADEQKIGSGNTASPKNSVPTRRSAAQK